MKNRISIAVDRLATCLMIDESEFDHTRNVIMETLGMYLDPEGYVDDHTYLCMQAIYAKYSNLRGNKAALECTVAVTIKYWFRGAYGHAPNPNDVADYAIKEWVQSFGEIEIDGLCYRHLVECLERELV